MSDRPGFLELGPEDLASYVRSVRISSAPFWFFQHIPKTAGTSLSAELEEHVAPYRNVLPDYQDETRPFHDRLDDAVAETLNDISNLNSASGHVFARHVDAILNANNDTKLFTFLRNPFRRCISEYAYNCSPAHPPHQEFRLQYPTLESFALEPTEANKMAKYLLPRREMDLRSALAYLNQRYAMIGLQERYPVCFLFLSSMAWRASFPRRKVRVGGTDDAASLGSPDLERRYTEANKLDYELYQAVESVYGRIATAIWSRFSPGKAKY